MGIGDTGPQVGFFLCQQSFVVAIPIPAAHGEGETKAADLQETPMDQSWRRISCPQPAVEAAGADQEIASDVFSIHTVPTCRLAHTGSAKLACTACPLRRTGVF